MSRINFIVTLAAKNKDVETKVANALRSEAISATGGRANPRVLAFNVADRKEAINARMRVYNLMKKLGLDVTVNLSDA